MVEIQPWDYHKETYGKYVLENKKELGINNTSLWGKNGAVEQAATKQGVDFQSLANGTYLKHLKPSAEKSEPVDNTPVIDKSTDTNSSIFGNSDPIKNSRNSEPLFSGNNQSNNKNVKVIVEGDSLSVGYGGQLKKLLGNNVETVNLANSGDTLIHKIEPELQSVMNEYDSDKKNIVVLTAGTNDIHNGARAQTVYKHLLETVKKLKDKGFEVIVGTNIKLNGTGNNTETPDKLEERQSYNNLIRNTSSAPWDKVVDLVAMQEFNDNPNSDVTSNASIYSQKDHIHLIGKGYKDMANAFYQGVANDL